MSSALDRIEWSSSDHSMKNFVDLFGDSLPILCQTTTGYSGCDEDIHQVAADEVFWIHSIQRQKRIVARDNVGRYISIPVVSGKFQFHIITKYKPYPLISSEQLLERMKNEMPSTSTDGQPLKIMFEDNQTVSYQIGADMGDTTRFGTMEIEETYEEKYLLGYALHSGSIFVRNVGIPVYLDISLETAIGFLTEDDPKGDRFKKWIDELRGIIETLESTPIKICQEIIVFPERPSNGDYEYIHPSKFVVNSRPKQQTKTENETEHEYFYIDPVNDSKTNKTNNKDDDDADDENLLVRKFIHLPQKGDATISSIPLPPMPRRRPPTPPPPPPSVYDNVINQRLATNENERLLNDEDETPPPLPPARSHSNTSTRVNSKPGESIPAELLNTGCVISSATPPIDSPLESPESCTAAMDIASDHVMTGTGQRLTSLTDYATASEVPIDVDVNSWTMDDVVECLRLLKIQRLADVFKEREIDGALLLNLTERMLVDEFGLKQFEATKFLMFTQKGWRPK